MKWYYAENNERRGPIDEADFQALAGAGTIKPETLVWREGMAAWQAYSEVAPGFATAARVAAPVAAVGAATMTVTTAARPSGVAGEGLCSQCGRAFSPDEMITYEGQTVCAECKPLFFQRVKEGALVSGQREYAGFWIRFGAKFVDGIINNIIGQVIGFALVMGLGANNTTTILSVVLGLMVGLAYQIYFLGKFGATPGKMACKLEVIRADGSPVTYGVAAGRYFAEIVSALTLMIGYIMAGFDEEKRALHDRMCGTRVVRKR